MKTLLLVLSILFPVGALAQVTIGVDPSNNVALIHEGQPLSAMPATLGALPLTAYQLTPVQAAAFRALPVDQQAKFDGNSFTTVALPAPPARVDAAGFALDCKAAVGGAQNIPAARIPQALLLWDAIRAGNWVDTQALIIAAQGAGVISGAQYATIKAAAASRNIPITLP